MAIDPTIARGVTPLGAGIPEFMAGLQQQNNQNMLAQNQNALAQYQLSSAQRSDAQQAGITNALGANPGLDPKSLYRFGAPGIATAGQISDQQFQEQQRAVQMSQIQAKKTYSAADAVINSATPKALAMQISPTFSQQWDQVHGQGAWDALSDDQVRTAAQSLKAQAQAALGQGPASPDEQLKAKNAKEINDNTQTHEDTRSAAGIAGANARTASEIAAANLRAGFSADGKIDPKYESTVDAILNYRQAPFTGRAGASGLGGNIMAEVNRRDPTYDGTTFPAKQAALKSLLAGKDAQTLDQTNTAVAHLSQLKPLLAALNSGDINLINSAKQAYQAATGTAAPTNASIVADLAAREVNKVVTGSPGTGDERDMIRSATQLHGSPDQQTGAMDNLIELMAGRLKGTGNRFKQAKLGPQFDNMLLPETKAALASHGYVSGASAAPSGASLTYDPATGTFK